VCKAGKVRLGFGSMLARLHYSALRFAQLPSTLRFPALVLNATAKSLRVDSPDLAAFRGLNVSKCAATLVVEFHSSPAIVQQDAHNLAASTLAQDATPFACQAKGDGKEGQQTARQNRRTGQSGSRTAPLRTCAQERTELSVISLETIPSAQDWFWRR
jgi:hypothetical protein